MGTIATSIASTGLARAKHDRRAGRREQAMAFINSGDEALKTEGFALLRNLNSSP